MSFLSKFTDVRSERLKKVKLDSGMPHLIHSFCNVVMPFVFEMEHEKRNTNIEIVQQINWYTSGAVWQRYGMELGLKIYGKVRLGMHMLKKQRTSSLCVKTKVGTSAGV